MTFYRWEAGDLVLSIRVTPRARRAGVDGLLQDRVRVRVTAPPVDSKANEAVRRQFASAFRVPRSRVEIMQGAKAVNKTIRVRHPATAPAWFVEFGGRWPAPQ